jgi:hypothetical protein
MGRWQFGTDVGDDRWALAALAAGAGAVHLAMVPSHMDAWAVEGALFAVVGWAQLLAAVGFVVSRDRRLDVAAAVTSAGLVALWAWSRTSGLPVGPQAGEAEAVGFVDVVAVGLEAALVAGVTVRRLGAALRPSGLLAVLPVTAVALASVAIASPSARDHAHAGEGSHAHDTADEAHFDPAVALAGGHTHEDDFEPYLPMDAATFKQLGEQLALVREVTLRFPTVADAKRAGLQRNGSFVPGQGAHYLPTSNVFPPGAGPLERPAAWLYAGADDSSPVVGVMYAGGAPRVDFAGPNDRWHAHSDVCQATRPSADGGLDTYSEGEGMTEAACATRGGRFMRSTGQLMHVWTVPGWESPIGVFSHDNPLVVCTDGRAPAEVTHGTGGCRGLS